VFFTALDLFGLEVGAVHTDLAALIRRAQREEAVRPTP
jgi:DNA-nicking Smr family endonuclease